MLKRSVMALMLVGLTIPAVAFGDDSQEIVRSFDIEGEARLTVKNISGEIRAIRGSQNRVVVRADKDNPDIEVHFSQKGDTIRVKVEHPRRSWWGGNSGGVDFEIEFPEVNGELALTSVSGSIEVEEIQGKLELKTVSGDVDIVNGGGDIRAQAVSGSITMKNMTDAEIDATTISGDVDYRGNLRGGDFSFSSTSGSVDVFHPSDAAYQIAGRTISGRVGNNLDGQIDVEEHQYSSIKKISGEVNGGGPSLDVNTVSGNIDIRVRD